MVLTENQLHRVLAFIYLSFNLNGLLCLQIRAFPMEIEAFHGFFKKRSLFWLVIREG